MKVAFVHNLARGGARRAMGEHLDRLRYDCDEFCLATGTPVTTTAQITAFAPVAPRLRHALRPAARYTDMRALLRAWQALSRQVQHANPDIVMLHPCQYLQCPPLTIQRRVVYFCHEARRVDYEPGARAQRRALTRPVYGPLYAWQRRVDSSSVHNVDGVITNSQYTATAIAAAYGRSSSVIPLGVPDLFLGGRSQLGLQLRRAHLLSVGSLIPTKGHDLAIRALAVSQISLPMMVVAPRPQPEEQLRLETLARDLGVSLQVRIGVTDEQLAELYESALATMYLARQEPLGLVSLEAQACGCPVIVAREGGLPETIIEDETGWSVPRDPAQAADRLRRLLDDAVRQRMASAAASHGAEYSWEASTRRLEQLLDT